MPDEQPRTLKDRSLDVDELKRRGMAALDDLLEQGPAYIAQDGSIKYVVLSSADYLELVEGYDEGVDHRVKDSLRDAKAGRMRRSTAKDIIAEFGLE